MTMDARCRSTSFKKKILLEEPGSDRLSNLPDFVLHHVLSFLETKDVVRTSVLSMRWRYICHSITSIDLKYESYTIEDDDRRRNLETSFFQFVDRVLILHDPTVLKRLRVNSTVPVHNSRLHCWICALTKRNVEELDLKLDVEGHSMLPSCLFACHSLTALKLQVQCDLKSPVISHLPNLNKLHLSRVRFMDNLSLERLSSICPVLDELALVECDWENINDVTISLPALRNLTIYSYGSHSYYSHIKFIAANLARLDFTSYLNIDIEFSDLSSLKAATVDITVWDYIDRMLTCAANLFSSICHVEDLTLSMDTIKGLSKVKGILGDDKLPIFYNLTHLTLNSEIDYGGTLCLKELFGKMPKLQYLEFSEGQDGSVQMKESHLQLDGLLQTFPTYSNFSLKAFATKKFKAGWMDRVMIEWVLRNAIVLESLSISCSKHLKKEVLTWFKHQLHSVPRASERCNIQFSF